MSHQQITSDTLYSAIAGVIQQARQQVRQAVNQQMVQAYWHIGCLIVEQEQQGKERAEYGKQQLERLSMRLQEEFGKGFDVTNLRKMRQFYLAFPIRDAVRLELEKPTAAYPCRASCLMKGSSTAIRSPTSSGVNTPSMPSWEMLSNGGS